MPGHSAQPVVRIVGLGLQNGKVLFLITNAIAVTVTDTQNSIPLGEIDPALLAELQVHGRVGLHIENLSRTVAANDHDLIVLRPVVVIRAKVRVAAHDPNIARIIDIDPRGCDNVRVLGNHRQTHARRDDLDLRRNVYLLLPHAIGRQTKHRDRNDDRSNDHNKYHKLKKGTARGNVGEPTMDATRETRLVHE